MPREKPALGACSAHAYVSGGAWVESRRNLSDWIPTCANFAQKARYVCKGKEHAWTWRPSSHCADPPPLMDLLAGRTLFVMGDSFGFELFVEVGCRLQREGARFIQTLKPWWAWQTNLPDRSTGRVHTCSTFSDARNRSRGRLCFVPVGTTGRYVPEGRNKQSVADALTYMATVNVTRATDVVLANEGAWLDAQHLRQRAEALRRAAVLSGAPAHRRPISSWPLVVWRESYAQHFPTATGAYNLSRPWQGMQQMACTHIAAPVVKPEALVNVSRALLHDDRGEESTSVDVTASDAREMVHPIALIDGWSLTSNLPLVHPGLVDDATRASDASLNSTSRSRLDCTHICTFNGINDAVIDALSSHLSYVHSSRTQSVR